MVIQRWQSVWLLIASIMVGIFCFLPMAVIPFDPSEAESASFISPLTSPVFFIVNAVTVILFFLDIFLFKNMRLQKQVIFICVFLLIASVVTACFMVYGSDSSSVAPTWTASPTLLLGALIFAVLAYRGIRHDERILRAADRLR